MESPHNNFILRNMYLFQSIAFPEISTLQVIRAYICWILTTYRFQIFKDILWIKTKFEGRREGKGLTHSPCRRKNMSSRESPKLWSRIIWKLKSHPQCDSRWCLLQTQVTISSRFFSKSFESPVVKVATISWFSACYIERENSFIVYSTNIHTFLDPIILYSLPTKY